MVTFMAHQSSHEVIMLGKTLQAWLLGRQEQNSNKGSKYWTIFASLRRMIFRSTVHSHHVLHVCMQVKAKGMITRQATATNPRGKLTSTSYAVCVGVLPWQIFNSQLSQSLSKAGKAEETSRSWTVPCLILDPGSNPISPIYDRRVHLSA